jgi:hypothetical protein
LCVCTTRQNLPRPTDILAQAIPETQSGENEVTAMKSKNQNLRRTRDLLLPRLLSGQVELNTN